jgi:long-chain acyl-CoA synthetase
MPGRMTLTSGTTGRPKAVCRAPIAPSLGTAYGELVDQWFGNRPGMRTAIVGPLYHSVQSIYAMAALRHAEVLLLPAKFSAEGLLDTIETQRLTHLNLVPIMMIRLLQLPEAVRARYDLSSLEFVIHGAAPCPPEVKRGIIEWWGPVLHEYYGTTEAGMMTRASSEEWLARPGTVGKAWPGRVLRILDEEDRNLPPRGEGEICASLDLLPDFTYVGDETARGAIARGGLVASGDIGFLDEEGYLFVCDRKKDMVVSGGVNIYPAEIEAVLLAHPDVADCAVFGIPSAEYGETLMAVVQPRREKRPEPEALRAHLLERLAGFKVPRHYELRRELPRDDSGKIRKQLLRAPYWEGAERRI